MIKPVPSQVQASQDFSFRDDDEMFLDEDDNLDSSNIRSNSATTKKETLASYLASKVPKITDISKQKDANEHKNTHIVYKRKIYDSDSHGSDFLGLEQGSSSIGHNNGNWTLISNNHSSRRHKRQAPETVWPEVLLVVDYDSYLLHGANSRDVKRYFISFWNGVDLRYKLLSNPLIRVSLAGMIVAKVRLSINK